LKVITVTDVPPFNVLLIVEADIVELSDAGPHTGPLHVAPLLVIVRSESGSSSQTPGAPLGAAALTEAKDPTTN
jgi:hypothetical protein